MKIIISILIMCIGITAFLLIFTTHLDKIVVSFIPRPQEPTTKERDYNIKEVSFSGSSDGVILSGELTYPKGKGPFSAVVLVTGQVTEHGPWNRNYNLGPLVGHKTYLVLSHLMTKRGYAVLRYDNRGVGESTGNWENATNIEYAADAAKAMKWLKNKSNIEISKSGYIGHSEGVIKSALASQIESSDFMVFLAGGIETTAELTISNYKALAKRLNIPKDEKEETLQQTQKVFNIIREVKEQNSTRSDAQEKIKKYFLSQKFSEEDSELIMQYHTEPTVFESLDRNWGDIIKTFKGPILNLLAGRDSMVQYKPNLEKFQREKVLVHSKSKTQFFKNYNHMFQPTQKDNGPEGYWEIETTFSEEVVDYIDNWIKEL